MNYKKLNLFLGGVLCTMLLFSIPVYFQWLNNKILYKDVNVFSQFTDVKIEDRKIVRYGVSYKIYKTIAATINATHAKDPLILLPPKNYLKAIKAENDFILAEPAVIYYFTGLKSVEACSNDVMRADWVLDAEDHHIGIRRVTSKQFLDSMLNVYKPYMEK